MISSAAGPNFVSKCSEDIQKMLVSPEVTFKETEERVIAPYLRIMEDASILEDGRNAAARERGGVDGRGEIAQGRCCSSLGNRPTSMVGKVACRRLQRQQPRRSCQLGV